MFVSNTLSTWGLSFFAEHKRRSLSSPHTIMQLQRFLLHCVHGFLEQERFRSATADLGEEVSTLDDNPQGGYLATPVTVSRESISPCVMLSSSSLANGLLITITHICRRECQSLLFTLKKKPDLGGAARVDILILWRRHVKTACVQRLFQKSTISL